MTSTKNEKLLKNKKAVEEINRHRWIESEKAGRDIGFETASVDWLEKFSAAWMQYHIPAKKASSGTTRKTRSAKTFTRTPPKKTKKKTKTSARTK